MGGRRLAILCAFEDRAFEDVVRPLVERLLAEEGLREADIRPLLTHGCQWTELGHIGRDYETWADLVIIGADTRGKTPAQKRRSMEKGLERSLPERLRGERCLLALAAPCAEGWIQADLAALKAGVAEELDDVVSLPGDAGAYPGAEQQAKDRLRTILERADVPALRGGLEYGPAVMRHVALDSEPSLAEFAKAFRHRLQRWRRGY